MDRESFLLFRCTRKHLARRNTQPTNLETPIAAHRFSPVPFALLHFQVEYLGISITTALTTFFLWPILSRVSVLSHMGTDFDGWLSQALDTIGLASFAVVGTQHGIRKGCHPLVTIIICMITCSGGGIIRDVSCRHALRAQGRGRFMPGSTLSLSFLFIYNNLYIYIQYIFFITTSSLFFFV